MNVIVRRGGESRKVKIPTMKIRDVLFFTVFACSAFLVDCQKATWPLEINNYQAKDLYHCIYLFFICTDRIGTWPSNKPSCLNYFRACENHLKKNGQGGGGVNDNAEEIIPGPKSCREVLKEKRQSDPEANVDSGVFEIVLNNQKKEVFCDMKFLGGGWTVIQKRGDFGRDKSFFLRKWNMYQKGFGDPLEDFWIGLDAMHNLTASHPEDREVQLMITLSDFDNNRTAIMINNFTVGTEEELYKISYKNYNSRIGNSLPARETPFSTIDNDNDAWSKNCANRFSGAWWYSACHNSNLNGLYLRGQHESFGNGVNWFHWKGYHYSLKTTEMKVRIKPKQPPQGGLRRKGQKTKETYPEENKSSAYY